MRARSRVKKCVCVCVFFWGGGGWCNGAPGKTVTDKLYHSAVARSSLHAAAAAAPTTIIGTHGFIIIIITSIIITKPSLYTIIYYTRVHYSSRVCTRCRTTPTERALPPPLNWVSIYYIVPSTLRSRYTEFPLSLSLPEKHNIVLLLLLFYHDERNNRKVALV